MKQKADAVEKASTKLKDRLSWKEQVAKEGGEQSGKEGGLFGTCWIKRPHSEHPNVE
jgi:hypothetical protein